MISEDVGLSARRLTSEDWRWIERWFRDPVLNTRLGPLDDEWFDEATATEDGVQLVISTPAGRPVALLGCAWDQTGGLHAFTDVAVDPQLRGSGYGRRALASAMAYPGHPPANGWVTFVDPKNKPAFAFFTQLGWEHKGLDEGMHRFTVCHQPPAR